MTLETTDQLREIMSERRECLGQICELGRRQLELIAQSELGTLLRVLSVKQRLLSHLQSVERRLDPFRDQAPESRQWRTAAERDQCARLASDCQRLLMEIVQQERQSEREMIEHREDAAAGLRGAHVAAQARGAYSADSGTLSGHLDLSCEQ